MINAVDHKHGLSPFTFLNSSTRWSLRFSRDSMSCLTLFNISLCWTSICCKRSWNNGKKDSIMTYTYYIEKNNLLKKIYFHWIVFFSLFFSHRFIRNYYCSLFLYWSIFWSMNCCIGMERGTSKGQYSFHWTNISNDRATLQLYISQGIKLFLLHKERVWKLFTYTELHVHVTRLTSLDLYLSSNSFCSFISLFCICSLSSSYFASDWKNKNK